MYDYICLWMYDRAIVFALASYNLIFVRLLIRISCILRQPYGMQWIKMFRVSYLNMRSAASSSECT